MSIIVSNLKIIAGKGGGMILDAAKFSANDLKIIVGKASETQAQITLKNPLVLSSSNLKIIAGKANGCVWCVVCGF